jgi:branched-chain amino acid transport system substrate-binding protein
MRKFTLNLVQVNKPPESKASWDYHKVLGTIPANAAFRPLVESTRPLVKKWHRPPSGT